VKREKPRGPSFPEPRGLLAGVLYQIVHFTAYRGSNTAAAPRSLTFQRAHDVLRELGFGIGRGLLDRDRPVLHVLKALLELPIHQLVALEARKLTYGLLTMFRGQVGRADCR
jgi:hypothetical protein